MRTIVYGNGKSRLKWDLKQNLHDDIITWGCNRIYNDTVVDNLVAVDYWVQHLVYESGYALNNKCWFGDWNILPSDFDIEHMRESWNKVTENTKKDYGCVVNGRNDELHKGLYITWIDENDMVEGVDFPKEWSSGTTAIHLACQQGATEIYLMGFDMSQRPLNNVYEEEQMEHFAKSPLPILYEDQLNIFNRMGISKDQLGGVKIDFEMRPDWVQEMKTTIKEFSDVKFIWVEPDERTLRLDMNNLTYDTYENIRRKICR